MLNYAHILISFLNLAFCIARIKPRVLFVLHKLSDIYSSDTHTHPPLSVCMSYIDTDIAISLSYTHEACIYVYI